MSGIYNMVIKPRFLGKISWESVVLTKKFNFKSYNFVTSLILRDSISSHYVCQCKTFRFRNYRVAIVCTWKFMKNAAETVVTGSAMYAKQFEKLYSRLAATVPKPIFKSCKSSKLVHLNLAEKITL